MIALAPTSLLAAVRALIGGDGDLDAQAVRSRWIDDKASATGSAAFVNHVGYWSQGGSRGGSLWPFPLDADAQEMYQIARHFRIVRRHNPRPGLIHLKFSEEHNRFVRASILAHAVTVPLCEGESVLYKSTVIEGNATLTPIAHDRFATKVHWCGVASEWNIPSNGDCFIDWVAMDKRDPTEMKPYRRSPYRSTVTGWRKRVG
jgi:hypothetical protein